MTTRKRRAGIRECLTQLRMTSAMLAARHEARERVARAMVAYARAQLALRLGRIDHPAVRAVVEETRHA